MVEERILVKLRLARKTIAGENIDPVEDLTNYLKPFPVKARTMRQQASPLPVLSSEASVHLDSSRCSRSEEEEEESGLSGDSGKLLKRKLEEAGEDGPGRDDKSQKTDSGEDYPRISETESDDGESTESEIEISGPDELSPTREVTSLGETPKVYPCSFCDKTFSSHLALGGHKSSHNKFKMIIYNAIDYKRRKKQAMIADTCDQQNGKIACSGENGASPESVVGDDRTHTCKICLMKFSSGQALGGHQRLHWTGNAPDQKTQSAAKKILDFDLNELSKEEDEDPSSVC